MCLQVHAAHRICAHKFMLHIEHVCRNSCCTLNMCAEIHAAQWTCVQKFMLHIDHVCRNSCCTLNMCAQIRSAHRICMQKTLPRIYMHHEILHTRNLWAFKHYNLHYSVQYVKLTICKSWKGKHGTFISFIIHF